MLTDRRQTRLQTPVIKHLITASTPLTLLRPLGEGVRGQGAGDELDQVAALGAVLAVPRPRHAAARR